MNFVKTINEMQNNISESMYIDIIEYYEFCEEKANEIEEIYEEFVFEFNKSLHEYKENVDDGWKLLCEYDEECGFLFDDCIEKKEEIEKKCIQRLIGFQHGIIKIRVRPNEESMIKARMIAFSKSMAKTMDSFSVDIFEKLQEVMIEMREEIIIYMKCSIGIEEGEIGDFKEINSPTVSKQNEKIFNYKDMIKLAQENGYQYKWTNGSHNIYEHSGSQKIVVIPSHSLGIGLSKKIMKQIQTNIA